MYPDHTILVPDGASDLHLRLFIIAHTGLAGHRGRNATERTLQSVFKWSSLAEDLRAFVHACINCLLTLGGEKISRPFLLAFHGKSLNDLVQFDYIELGDSQNGDKYVLMLFDEHSDYKLF